MATNYALIRYQADNIPLFDGNTKHISRFITACENFLGAHQDRANVNAPLNIALFDTILSKLTGRAADLIASRIELNSWNLVKDAIYATFSDQRSTDCVVQDIITMKPYKSENSLQFGIRLQDARSLLYSKVNASNDPREVKLLKISEYGKLTMKTFINGLDYHMQLVIRLKNPQTLEEAMTHAIEEENFIYFRNRNSVTNKISPHSSSIVPNQNKNNIFQSQPVVQTMHRPIFHRENGNVMHTMPTQLPRPTFNAFQHNTTPTQQYHNNFPRNQYQNGSNLAFKGYGQFRPRSNQTRNFQHGFTNQNQFGQSNRLRQFNQNQNFSRGEPMDISSGNTIIKRALQQQNRPQNRTFTSQELYNQSVETPTEEEFPQNPNDESFAFDTPIMSNNNFDPYTNEENNQCFDSENDNYVDTNFQYENMQQSDNVNFRIDPSISHQI